MNTKRLRVEALAIVPVVINAPEYNAGNLKHVEGMQNLERLEALVSVPKVEIETITKRANLFNQ